MFSFIFFSCMLPSFKELCQCCISLSSSLEISIVAVKAAKERRAPFFLQQTPEKFCFKPNAEIRFILGLFPSSSSAHFFNSFKILGKWMNALKQFQHFVGISMQPNRLLMLMKPIYAASTNKYVEHAFQSLCIAAMMMIIILVCH